MKIYTLQQTYLLPATPEQAWAFFSAPENLALITPEKMAFRIEYNSGTGNMYAGQLIRYTVSILPGIRANWLTEITHVREPHYFIDEQRVGPYALWHHQHHFKPVSGGVEMTDIVNYAIPFGIIGRLANRLFVERQLNAIFEYRSRAVARYFPNRDNA
jgi:ligand-binding SRPBCC domain-containing protein